MLVYSSSAFSAVRILGSGGNTMVGASGTSTELKSPTATTTTAVSQSTRGSSLRFSNPTQVASATSSQSYSGLSNAGGTSVGVADSASSRLSIGKYLNLSHSKKPISTGGGTSGGGISNVDLDNLQNQIDRLQTSVDGLKVDKQNTLIVGDGEYIDISGDDNNVISIDINALKHDLQDALGTQKDLLTEIDEGYKLWWCYANNTGDGCVNEKQLIVDLGTVLKEYDLANENVSLSEALAGKQGKLTTTDAGYIAIDQEAGTIDVKFQKLKDDLGISNAKQSEIQFTQDGKLQWRYLDDYEEDGKTKKWTTADIDALMRRNLDGYVQLAILEDYVKKSELSGMQGNLEAASDKYIEIVDNKIGVKFAELKNALNIPQEREVEIDFTDDGKIKWRYVGDTAWHQTNQKVSDFVDLTGYVLRSELAGLQGALTADENGYLQINNNKIGIKFQDLKNALEIPDAQRDIEMEITDGGLLRWRYLDSFEIDGTTKKWVNVSNNINTLIDNKLANYVTETVFQNTLNDYQKTLSADAGGFITINNDVIGLKLQDLKNALNIPDAAEKIEMEITDAGKLRWRYLNEFEPDGTTKKWTDVSVNIGDLIDGKLENYVDNTSLTTTLNDYVTNSALSTQLQDYALKTYVDTELAKKQVKLTESPDGFIAITSVDGGGEEIGIKFDELKNALGIDSLKTAEIRVDNGVLQWRYMNEFETDAETGAATDVKKWTTVYDLKSLLDGYVTESALATVVERIDRDLAGKQIKLTPAEEGYIILNEQTGEIAVDMAGLRSYLSIEGDSSRTSEMRVFDGKLQWRYLDEYETEANGNRVQVWHTLDLTAVELPLYVKKAYLTDNYYNKVYIDNLARTIENNINASLANIWPDEGLYLLSVSGSGDNKTPVWQSVKIVDGDGVVH